MKVYLFFILFLFCLFNNNIKAEKCYAIALEGGGDRGAYEAAVLDGLVNNLPPSECAWNVATGISAGSINVFAMSLFKVGDEKAMTNYMLEIVDSLSNSKIFTHWGFDWPEGLYLGVTKERGLLNTEPLRETLTNVYKEKGPIKDRKFVIGATSMTKGTLTRWNETLIGNNGELLINASMASSAIPGAFPYQSFQNDYFQDGGVLEGVNVIDAIRRCFEITSEPSEITIDVVLTSRPELKQEEIEGMKTIGALLRSYQISRYNAGLRQIREAQQAYPNVNWRYYITPSQTLPGDGLNFDQKDLQEMVTIGKKDAKNVINSGPNFPKF